MFVDQETRAQMSASAEHYARGVDLVNAKDLDGAIDSFKAAISLTPDHAMAYNALGVIYSEHGDQQLAIDSFAAASHFDPSYAEPHNNVAVLFARLGRHEEA